MAFTVYGKEKAIEAVKNLVTQIEFLSSTDVSIVTVPVTDARVTEVNAIGDNDGKYAWQVELKATDADVGTGVTVSKYRIKDASGIITEDTTKDASGNPASADFNSTSVSAKIKVEISVL